MDQLVVGQPQLDAQWEAQVVLTDLPGLQPLALKSQEACVQLEQMVEQT